LKATTADGKQIFKKLSDVAPLQDYPDGEHKLPHSLLIITISTILSTVIGTSLLAWDYESNMDILGVLCAQFDHSKEEADIALVLNLFNSSSCQLLRRIKLDQFHERTPDQIALKLDTDLCVVSMWMGVFGYENRQVRIRVYRFNRKCCAE